MLVLNNGGSVGRQAALFQTGKQVVQVHAAETERKSSLKIWDECNLSFCSCYNQRSSINLFLISSILDNGRAKIPGTSGNPWLSSTRSTREIVLGWWHRVKTLADARWKWELFSEWEAKTSTWRDLGAWLRDGCRRWSKNIPASKPVCLASSLVIWLTRFDAVPPLPC